MKVMRDKGSDHGGTPDQDSDDRSTAQMRDNPSPIVMRPRVVVTLFAGVLAALFVGHLIVMFMRFELGHAEIIDRLNLDAEPSLGQFTQAVLLLALAALLFAIGHRTRDLGDRYARWWIGLAVVFTYLAIDEGSQLHEMSIGPLRGAFDTGGPLLFAWLIVAIPFVVMFGVVCVPFLRALPSWTRNRIVLAGLLYVAGAIGMEMLSGVWVDARGFDATYFYLFVTIEEALEVSGLLLFLSTLLSYVARMQGRVVIDIGRVRSSGGD